jgi:hypothetical protein
MLNTIILWVGWLGWIGNAVCAAFFPDKYVRTVVKARLWASAHFLAALTGTFYLLTSRVESKWTVHAVIAANVVSLIAGSRLLSWRPGVLSMVTKESKNERPA